jgi:hypothetical protein
VSFVPQQDSHAGTYVELQKETECARCRILEAELEQAIESVGALSFKLHQSALSESALRRQLTAMRTEHPESKKVRAALEHWRDATRRKGNTKIPIEGKRADAIRRARNWGFSFDDIHKAIDGAARFPYVVNYERSRSASDGSKRRDDLDTILKSEKQIELLMTLATEEPQPQHRPPPAARLPRAEIEAILGKLEKVRQEGPGRWEACCPAHDDRHASLFVSLNRVGIGLHCHTGCDVDAIAAELGYAVTQLFHDDDQPTPKQPPATPPERLPSQAELAAMHGRLVSSPKLIARLTELRGWTKPTLERLYVGFDGKRIILPIRDEQGELVNVLRYLPGERREGERKLLAARGRGRELFPSPESFDTAEMWLVEGEPDAISAHQLGLTGFAVPGSNGWRTTWAARFRGRVVVVCFDCDKAGRDAAQRVANSLVEEAREVRVVDLAPDRNDGFDLSDFVHDGGHVRDLLRMAASSSAIHALRSAA